MMKNKRKHTCLIIAAAALAALVLTGICIFIVIKMNHSPLAEASEEPASGLAAEEMETSDQGMTEMGMQALILAVSPYITCGGKLYYHSDNASSEMALQEISETAYGIWGTPVDYDLLSENGELSDRIYLRDFAGNKDWSVESWPLYWVFDYVCDTDEQYGNTTVEGRYPMVSGYDWGFEYYGSNSSDGPCIYQCHYYPGKSLQTGNLEIYECLTDDDSGKIPVKDLYMLKVNPEITENLVYSPILKDAVIPEDLYLLASPDWEAFHNSLEVQ